MKQLLCAVTLITSLLLHAQDSDKGIHWTTGLSWEQVKQKAKAENKYIFLDCYTTWCGPCKMMDRLVYVNDTVGQLMNDKFISVRVQMEKDQGDNENVKAWYKDAAEIKKRYLIEGYPTFLFFSPDGNIVNKGLGFKVVDSFLNVAKVALTPGRKFNDDYAIYQKLKVQYDDGNVPYDQIPFMVTMAKKMWDTSIVHRLLKSYTEYVSKLKPKELYTKENIQFWSTLNLGETSKLLQFFAKDSKRIDRVMRKKGYSAKQVDRCIQNFIVNPFIDTSLKDPNVKSTPLALDASTGQPIYSKGNKDEANWDSLYQLIRKDFSNYYAKRNVLKAKATWYDKNRNWMAYAKAKLEIMKQYPPDLNDKTEAWYVNDACWKIFLAINDRLILNETIKWSKKVVDASPKWNDCIDTYANLLYKVGKKNEAIRWEERAVALTINLNDQRPKKTVEQMKRGEPTYGVMPLVIK